MNWKVQDTKLENAPLCKVCSQPMELVDEIKFVKGLESIEIKIYTCWRDRTFSRVKVEI